MAGLKIIWSEEAGQCFHQISSFYCSQAGNSAYVRKLLQMITGTLRLVSSYPYMYRAASAPDTRVFVCEYFRIYYSVHSDYILVESIFDTRQDPIKDLYQ